MDQTLAVAIIGAITTVLAGLFGAWASRRNSRDARAAAIAQAEASEMATNATTLQAFIDDLLARVKEVEANLRQSGSEIEHLQERVRQVWEMWEAEREAKHKVANEAHAQAMIYEHAMGDLREAHAREMGELKACYESALEKIEALKARILELENHVSRLESST